MYVHIVYVRTYIYIGTYLSSEGLEDLSEINFGPILGQKNWGKKIGINKFILIMADKHVPTNMHYKRFNPKMKIFFKKLRMRGPQPAQK